MFICEHCDKEFNTRKALSGHMSVHREGGRHTKSRKRKELSKSKCLTCEVEFEYNPAQSKGKYCSNKCSAASRLQLSAERLKEGKLVCNDTIRKAFFTLGVVNCSECGLGDSWNNKKLVLQVDHIDGNSDNNSYVNLRLLCPNCHTQTSTFTKRNTKNAKRNVYMRSYRGRD